MIYAQVNSVPFGSTGAVMRQVHEGRVAVGDESWMLWGRGRAAREAFEFNYGTRAGVVADAALTRLDGRAGLHSHAATRRLLAKLDEIGPDVVHLHNLHGYHVNYELLFGWLAARGQRTVWTLHDCWALTGHCAYFTHVGCDRWETGCPGPSRCPQLDTYPRTWCASTCGENWRRKRDAFTSLDPGQLTLVTPSEWLAGIVRRSYLGGYPIEVRSNTVDETVFRPTPSDFRARHGLGERFVVLGVASPWTRRKGLEDFLELRRRLPDDVAIVLVGLSRSQARSLPAGVLGLERVEPEELACIYTASDLLFVPSREETFGMTILEAHLCGCPAVAYAGGAAAETCGRVGGHVVTDLGGVVDLVGDAGAPSRHAEGGPR